MFIQHFFLDYIHRILWRSLIIKHCNVPRTLTKWFVNNERLTPVLKHIVKNASWKLVVIACCDRARMLLLLVRASPHRCVLRVMARVLLQACPVEYSFLPVRKYTACAWPFNAFNRAAGWWIINCQPFICAAQLLVSPCNESLGSRLKHHVAT